MEPLTPQLLSMPQNIQDNVDGLEVRAAVRHLSQATRSLIV